MGFTENDVASHSTDLFRPVEQEVSMTGSNTIAIRPVSFCQSGPYAFNITPRGNQYIQLNQIRLYVKGQVVHKFSETAIDLEDGVGVCNLLPNALFQSIDVDIGGRQINELQNTNLGYKAYLETLLSYSVDSKKGHLSASGWEPDSAGHFADLKFGENTVDDYTINTQNVGLIGRRKSLDRIWDYMIPLHCDFLNTERLLPPGVDLTLRLTRSDKDSFMLMHNTDPGESGTPYMIKLLDLKLYVPYITVTQAIVDRHISMIRELPVLLPIKKTEITVHHFGAGASNIYMSNLFQNRLPKTLIMGFLASDSFNGVVSSNPFEFKHFDVNHVQAIRNGDAIPNEPYTPEWEGRLYNRELRCFFDNIGIGTDNLSCGMTSMLYRGGATFFAWDFTPGKSTYKTTFATLLLTRFLLKISAMDTTGT